MSEIASRSIDPETRAAVDAVASISAIAGILDVICRTTGMGFAAVARVTDSRWIACAVKDDVNFGITPGGELELKTTICDEIRDSRAPVVFDDAREDPLYVNHPTPRIYGLRSYVSFPIVRSNGELFGTLCAIDPEPRSVSSPETREMFRLFAELIAFHLDASDRLGSQASDLRAERSESELRNQFIAILGHDLRNPVASIEAGLTLLGRSDLSDRNRGLVNQMRASTTRISRLIADVLDFAQGQSGVGLAIAKAAEHDLEAAIEQVISELQQSNPDRIIKTFMSLEHPVAADPERIGQLLSNLLGNAMTHGSPAHPVEVHAKASGGTFTLSVSNGGKAIAPEALPNLFKPFTRANIDKTSGGLGLGLFIAHKIAEAHRGTLAVASDDSETRFTLTIAPPGA